jgi:hypothetical protein
VDAAGVARRLGLTIVRDGKSALRARFVNLGGAAEHGGQGTIYLANEPRSERRQWAIAHEIAESQAHRVFAELGVDLRDARDGVREAVANRLAGCLLLPRDWFLPAGAACDWDLFELKAQFATASHELAARRMLDMPPPVIITLWDNGQRGWRRSTMPGRTPQVAACEADARRMAHITGFPVLCDRGELPDGVEDVRAWPIHEAGWRREIVRLEVRAEW